MVQTSVEKKLATAVVATAIAVAVLSSMYFQVSSAMRKVADEDSPARDVLNRLDESVAVLFPLLTPGALTLLTLLYKMLSEMGRCRVLSAQGPPPLQPRSVFLS